MLKWDTGFSTWHVGAFNGYLHSWQTFLYTACDHLTPLAVSIAKVSTDQMWIAGQHVLWKLLSILYHLRGMDSALTGFKTFLGDK